MYELRIEKRSEPRWKHWFSSTGVVQMASLLLDEDKGLRPLPAPRSRRIEFVGDIAAACQIEAPHGDYLADLGHQNALKSYAVVAAKALQAEWNIVATTQHGVIPQGWCTSRCCENILADLYPRAVLDDSSCGAEALEWEADAVVILVGYHWFSYGCMPSGAALREGYQALFESIRTVQKDARIICIALDWETMPGGAGLEQHQEICERVIAGMWEAADAFDDPKVQCLQLRMPSHIRLEYPDDWASRAHWSATGHQKVGEALVPLIADQLNWPLRDAGRRTKVCLEEEDENPMRQNPTLRTPPRKQQPDPRAPISTRFKTSGTKSMPSIRPGWQVPKRWVAHPGGDAAKDINLLDISQPSGVRAGGNAAADATTEQLDKSMM